MKGKTRTGFSFEIDKDVIDYELVEVIAETDENPLVVPKLLKMLIGEKQLKDLKEHLRNEKGKIPFADLMEEVKDILSFEEIKN